MTEDKLQELLKEASHTWRVPPEPRVSEMWAGIEARHFDRPRNRLTPNWWVLVSAPSAPPQRAWDPQAALAFAYEQGLVAAIEEFSSAVVAEREGTVLITGSFHTVGDALKLIGTPGPSPG